MLAAAPVTTRPAPVDWRALRIPDWRNQIRAAAAAAGLGIAAGGFALAALSPPAARAPVVLAALPAKAPPPADVDARAARREAPQIVAVRETAPTAQPTEDPARAPVPFVPPPPAPIEESQAWANSAQVRPPPPPPPRRVEPPRDNSFGGAVRQAVNDFARIFR